MQRTKMEELVKLQPKLDNNDLKTILLVEDVDNNSDPENSICPMFPKILKSASLKGIKDGTIILEMNYFQCLYLLQLVGWLRS